MPARDAQPVPLFPEESFATPRDRDEAAAREVRALQQAPPEMRIFSEFRRKAALYEVLSKAFESLAQALRFSGRITLTFHQGKITKVALKEAYYRNRTQQPV